MKDGCSRFFGKLLHEPGREQPEISCEHDEFHSGLAQGLDDRAIVLFALAPLARKYEVLNARALAVAIPPASSQLLIDDGDLRE